MPGLSDNLLNLARLKRQRETVMANLAEPLRLKLVAPSGSNPGELRMLTYVPPGLPAGAPLVVALHGCTQNAAAYDHGSGWSVLAQRHGFAVLFPEQQRSNNSNLCFNWFQSEDITRGRGEVESIRAMVDQVIGLHQLDPRRVFVTVLSAGGAMAAAMLATAPELFAGAGLIAGLPYGSAHSMGEAFAAMGQSRHHSAKAWGDLVRAAAPRSGARPMIQIWHGDADATVNVENAASLALQWSDVLELSPTPDRVDEVDGARHQAWLDGSGVAVLERWSVPGLGHGTPITPGGADLDRSVGVPGPHMLASSVSSTWHLARSWGLLTQAAAPRPERPAAHASTAAPGGSVIERALRTAGLMH